MVITHDTIITVQNFLIYVELKDDKKSPENRSTEPVKLHQKGRILLL